MLNEATVGPGQDATGLILSTSNDVFTIDSQTCTDPIGAGDPGQCAVVVSFTPDETTALGEVTANLVLTYGDGLNGDPNPPLNIASLTGVVEPAPIPDEAAVLAVVGDAVEIDLLTVILDTDPAANPITNTSAEVTVPLLNEATVGPGQDAIGLVISTNNDVFTVDSQTCTDPIGAGDSGQCAVVVSFTPDETTALGEVTANLVLTYGDGLNGDPNPPLNVASLTGVVEPAPIPDEAAVLAVVGNTVEIDLLTVTLDTDPAVNPISNTSAEVIVPLMNEATVGPGLDATGLTLSTSNDVFTVESQTCTNPIAAGASGQCAVILSFTPDGATPLLSLIHI